MVVAAVQAYRTEFTESEITRTMRQVDGLYEEAQSALRVRRGRMLENTAFYRGWQWAIPRDNGIFPHEYTLDPRERPVVQNYMRAVANSAVGSKLRAFPNPQCVASRSDIRGLARAAASQRLVRSFPRNGVFPYIELYRGVLDSEIKGYSFLKVFWNPYKGKRRRTEMGWQFEGDIDVRFVSAIDGLPAKSSTSENHDDMWHFFHRKKIAVPVLEDRFQFDVFGQPTRGRFVTEDWANDGLSNDIDAIENDGAAQIFTMGHSGGGASDEGDYTSSDTAELVEYWEMPSNRYPGGRLMVKVGAVVLAYTEEWPYDFPFITLYGANLLANGFGADGALHDGKPIQRDMNMGAAKLREWVEHVLHPAFLVPRKGGVDKDHMSTMVGEKIQYNVGFKPEWLLPPAPPQAIFENIRQQENTLKSVTGFSDITRGAEPPANLSGRAMAFIDEFEKSARQPNTTLFQLQIGKAYEKCLMLARDYYPEDRLVRIIGEDGQWERREFKRDDYDFDVEIVIEPFSSAPNSRALRVAETLEFFQLGMLADTPEAQRARRLLELDAEDKSTINVYEAHKRRAQSEELQFLANPFAPLEVLKQDHDDTHLDCHGLFAISAEFLAQPKPIQERFLAHIEWHEMQRSEKYGVYAQEASMLGGPTQSPSGGPPPPKQPGVESPIDGGGSEYPVSDELVANEQDMIAKTGS